MIRGNVREYVPQNAETVLNANIHNRFDIEVRDAKTNQLKQKAQAFNVICDNFWSAMGGYFGNIVYSNGHGTPSVSDTTTFGTWYSKEATNAGCVTDIESGVTYRTRKIVLSETEAVGVTITEVGLGSTATYKRLYTHAMLQDMNGNPISITKTSTDILTIYATVYVHWSPSGQNGVALWPPFDSHTTYSMRNFMSCAMGYGSVETTSGQYTYTYAYLLGGKGTVRGFGYSAGKNGSYKWDAATKTMTYTFNRVAVDKLNVPGGIGLLSLGTQFCFIDPRDEYEVRSEAVGTGDGSATHFATKFDMPTNATVYVDGVAMTSGVLVRSSPTQDDAVSYLHLIRDVLHDGKPCLLVGPATINANGGKIYLYNPYHETMGMAYISSTSYSSYLRFAYSDDLVNWSDDYNSSSAAPEEYRWRKYIRITNTHTSQAVGTGSLSGRFFHVDATGSISGKNIIFDTPPAVGSVITIDYTTPFVPKDENHVYDLAITIQFGEYTEN